MVQENKEYGERIKEERKLQGLTQDELAMLCDKEQSYISGVENGNIGISLEIFMGIMAAMNVRVAVTVDSTEMKSNDYLLQSDNNNIHEEI